ncbi:sigma-70 family RNA polymerase sigma factor [Nocardia sp. CDC153]|uniref:sigma-70 family RNA polymerase sigma factor n=1 Tax=Nocardia sp. CDC153 TaxID=3112167 RepID=UPI002DB9F8DD|nr:sigma-70 family RNA polymerase sigma factor [Nocardia sp. CDC153]MEC3957595.1 sigma-70 family RNA polymerase sigma factor [Nocardia sp. CDC153]
MGGGVESSAGRLRGAERMADVDFAATTDRYRRELLAHCYRMLGSVQDAEDLVQETLLRAWRARDSYDESRAGMRTWLYRIATNACLTALEQRGRRPMPSGLGHSPGDDPREGLMHGGEIPWLQPIPDSLIADPSEAALSQGSLRLAFVAAMQQLPARQRAVLVLREVLDWPAAQVAQALDMTPAGVNSALQRARKTLSQSGIREDDVSESAGQRAVVDSYVTAFRNADLAALEKLLSDDVILEMPPMLNWYVGRANYAGFIARVFDTSGSDWRMLPVWANGQPALAAYVRDGENGYALHSLQVFTVRDGLITHMITYFQFEELFRIFELEPRLP